MCVNQDTEENDSKTGFPIRSEYTTLLKIKKLNWDLTDTYTYISYSSHIIYFKKSNPTSRTYKVCNSPHIDQNYHPTPLSNSTWFSPFINQYYHPTLLSIYTWFSPLTKPISSF